MKRKAETIGSTTGVLAEMTAGAKVGSPIGIAVDGPIGAFAGTIPCAIDSTWNYWRPYGE